MNMDNERQGRMILGRGLFVVKPQVLGVLLDTPDELDELDATASYMICEYLRLNLNITQYARIFRWKRHTAQKFVELMKTNLIRPTEQYVFNYKGEEFVGVVTHNTADLTAIEKRFMGGQTYARKVNNPKHTRLLSPLLPEGLE